MNGNHWTQKKVDSGVEDEKLTAILALRQLGWSKGLIAKQLKLHSWTVSSYLQAWARREVYRP